MAYTDTEQEAVKKTWAGEKAKLKQMSFSEKLEYIWAYYKLHILVIVLILGAITWGVHHALTYVQYRLYGMVINSSQFNEELNTTLHDKLGMAKHDGINITADLSEIASGLVESILQGPDRLLVLHDLLGIAFHRREIICIDNIIALYIYLYIGRAG